MSATTTETAAYACGLCGVEISAVEACRVGCAISSSCSLVRCPNCGYQFPDPQHSKLAGWFARLVGARRRSLR